MDRRKFVETIGKALGITVIGAALPDIDNKPVVNNSVVQEKRFYEPKNLANRSFWYDTMDFGLYAIDDKGNAWKINLDNPSESTYVHN